MKRLNLSLIISLFLLSFCLEAQIRETRTLQPFNEVHIKGGCLVELIKGDSSQLEILSPTIPLEDIITKVNKQGKLVVKRKVDVYKMVKYVDEDTDVSLDRRVKIRITYQNLNQIRREGSGWLKVSSPIEQTQLRLKNSGSGDLVLEQLNCQNLKAVSSGSGKIIFKSGAATQGEFQISGSGKIEAYGLKVQDCLSRISGSGGMNIWVEEKLSARISGAGSIRYKGQPEQQITKVSGSGKVRAASND